MTISFGYCQQGMCVCVYAISLLYLVLRILDLACIQKKG